MSEIARWYVLHTYSGYENTVASAITKHVDNRNLHHLINEVKIPMEKVTEMTDKGPKEYERKTFPGYVLVKMILTDETWHILRNIRGVTGFVGSGNDAIPLSDEEIAALGVERNEVVTGYQPGDRIKIIDGPSAITMASWRKWIRQRNASGSWHPCSTGRLRWNWDWIR